MACPATLPILRHTCWNAAALKTKVPDPLARLADERGLTPARHPGRAGG